MTKWKKRRFVYP